MKMAENVNAMHLVGRVNKKPAEAKKINEDASVVRFRVGTETMAKLANGTSVVRRLWIQTDFWTKDHSTARTLAAALPVDAEVEIKGSLSSESWEGKGGERQFAIRLVADEVTPLLKAEPEKPKEKAKKS